MLPPRRDLLKIIEAAMLEKAPRMHSDLKASGQLDKVLSERAKQAQDSYEVANSQLTSHALSAERNLPYLETVSELKQGRSSAAREALNHAVEFGSLDELRDRHLEGRLREAAPRGEREGEPDAPGGGDRLSQVLYLNKDSGGKTDVTLALKQDGSLELFYYDIGVDSKRMWGDSDFEHWITIPAKSLPQLAFRLLAERYDNRSDSVSDLQKFCEQHSIEHQHHSWR